MRENMRYAHFAKICEKCGKVPNMLQSHIRVFLTCLSGDQELQRLARNIRRGNLELGAEDNDGLSQQACTALAGE